VGLILGVDGGNSKTALLVATTEGELVASLRGPGTNTHAVGPDGVADVIGALVAKSGADLPVDHGVFFLCGADAPSDIAGLERVIGSRGWAYDVTVDNDTFALLRAGTDASDAVAVICGAGINVVGRAAGGRIARYPSLGWETGDWGGAVMLGREVLRLAARGEDGRGEPTALTEIVRDHFAAATVEDVGGDVYYGRLPQSRLAELAPQVVVAAAGDAVAWSLVERLAVEIGLMARRAMRDLRVEEADVVLGGGMLQGGEGLLYETVLEHLPEGARAVAVQDPPSLGSALAALDAAGASVEAKARLRSELRAAAS
jgi:N-acetylglucosamine kinase-like BadF-type ATPase